MPCHWEILKFIRKIWIDHFTNINYIINVNFISGLICIKILLAIFAVCNRVTYLITIIWWLFIKNPPDQSRYLHFVISVIAIVFYCVGWCYSMNYSFTLNKLLEVINSFHHQYFRFFEVSCFVDAQIVQCVLLILLAKASSFVHYR